MPTKSELQTQLKTLGLKHSGTKAELISRLANASIPVEDVTDAPIEAVTDAPIEAVTHTESVKPNTIDSLYLMICHDREEEAKRRVAYNQNLQKLIGVITRQKREIQLCQSHIREVHARCRSMAISCATLSEWTDPEDPVPAK